MQEIVKLKKRAYIAVVVIVALFSASFLPMAHAMQLVMRAIVILVCLAYMAHFTAQALSARREGDYSWFLLPVMLFVVALNTVTFLPISETTVGISRLCTPLITIISSIVFVGFSMRRS